MLAIIGTLVLAGGTLVLAFDRFGTPRFPNHYTFSPILAVIASGIAYLAVRATFGDGWGWVFIGLTIASLWSLPIAIYGLVERAQYGLGWKRSGSYLWDTFPAFAPHTGDGNLDSAPQADGWLSEMTVSKESDDGASHL